MNYWALTNRLVRLLALSSVLIFASFNLISLKAARISSSDSELLSLIAEPSVWNLSGVDPSQWVNDGRPLSDPFPSASLPTLNDTSPTITNKHERDVNDSTTIPNSSDWKHAIQEATKLIYRDSPPEILKFWLSQPPPTIYIYDNIPAAFSDVENISSCVDHKFLRSNYSDIWVEKKKNCRWRPRVCQDMTPPNKRKEQMFVGARYNYNTDVAFLDKFRRYPFQTTDPAEADLFVVPYPHKSHCLCHKDFKIQSSKCSVPYQDIEDSVLSKLLYREAAPRSMIPYIQERHVFFHGADWLQELPRFREATSKSATLSLGAVLPCTNELQKPCGHVTVPYLVTEPDYQPNVASGPLMETVWSESSSNNRPYMVAAALGSPKGLAMRGQFLKQWKKWIGDSIGGKPHAIINIGSARSGQTFMELYRNSTVCLILPGDGCAQKRFFDVLLNGCVPFVPLWPSNDKESPYSFFRNKRCSTRITYPFAKGSFFQDTTAGFDILSMVATFNGTCGLPCLKTALEEFVSNDTAVQDKRRRLREYATAIRFGLTSESDSFPDVFAALIVRLRHYAWSILGRRPYGNTTG